MMKLKNKMGQRKKKREKKYEATLYLYIFTPNTIHTKRF
jgi:hypothetical protein